MATPIRSIPPLRGKDSVHFNKILEENKDKKISNEDYNRICDTVNSVMEANPWTRTNQYMKKR